MNKLKIIIGDITEQQVDAIVNAANSSLLGGEGVDGAIHRAAGYRLLEECRKIGGCPTGEARITHGYNLKAKWVIHTVGPIWHGGNTGEEKLLANCYRNSFSLASQYSLHSLAFPSISTGAYRYPLQKAVAVALREIKAGLKKYPEIELVLVMCFGVEVYEEYRRTTEDMR